MTYNLKFKVSAPSGEYTMIKLFETESINMAISEGAKMEDELTTKFNVFEFVEAEEQKYNLELFEEMYGALRSTRMLNLQHYKVNTIGNKVYNQIELALKKAKL